MLKIHYCFFTGYPYHGNPTQAPQPSQNDVNVDYYDYYNYEYETEAPGALSKSDVLISPHPFLVSVQRWLKGLDLQTARFDLGLFTGNTVVSLQYFSETIVGSENHMKFKIQIVNANVILH